MCSSDLSTVTTKFLDCGNAGTSFQSFVMEIQNPYAAKYTTAQSHYTYDGATVWWGGMHKVTTSYTDLTFTLGSGTITGGAIYVYGYRKAV